MKTTSLRLKNIAFLVASLIAVWACGKSDSGSAGASDAGNACVSDDDCLSGSCVSGKCAAMSSTSGGAGNGASSNTSDAGNGPSSNTSGASAVGTSTTSGGQTGMTGTTAVAIQCTVSTECPAGACVDGRCVTSTTVGPQWPGSGITFRPLTTGCPPSTKDSCTGTCEGIGGDPAVSVIRPPATLCFYGEGDATPEDPAAVIEQVIETVNGQSYVHIRVTFDPTFTDNTYGTGACCGWSENRGHTMRDLSVSDHTELLLTNGAGSDVLSFKIDLVEVDATATCGYATAGVTGGDGAILLGDSASVLGVSTSMHRNLVGCGYCTESACGGDCKVNSPTTDANYTPNPETPNWDYRQVYEVWVALEAFGGDFGQAYITYTHSSPAKTSTDTITVTGGPCPGTWDVPYCPPGATDCFGSGTPDGCPVNYQYYITSEGAVCTPIPFAGWPNKAGCPTGYTLDIASEGQYCVPL